MNTSFYKIFFIASAIFCFFLNVSFSYGHPIIPEKIRAFIEKNPDVTREELDAFMMETYGKTTLKEIYDSYPETANEEPNYLGSNENIQNCSDLSCQDSKLEVEKIKKNTELILSVKGDNVSFLDNAKEFTKLGVEHILIGLDHILFVLSLILILAPWRKILAMITTFTIAHSLTLILAGSSVLALSGKVVEPIIAFSIAYMAITSVFLKKIPFFRKGHNKIGVIFLFGLFHGLGFAGVFSELHIPANQYLPSLLFFNVGVEIGQILILLIALPVIYLLSKNKKIYETSIKVFAGIISLLALFWVIERLFF